MERKIGETFEFEGKTYKVVKDFTFSCRDCDFQKFCSPTKHISQEFQAPVECANTKRSDKENVIFKEIKDNNFITISSIFSDNNSLKNINIECPTGFSIDTENSDLKAGIIKFKKKELTYKDIQDSVGKYPTFTFVTPRNRLKLNAINMLMDIAKYYNGDWKPDWSNIKEDKYSILCWENNYYDIGCNGKACKNGIFFKNKEDAQAVIDNPHFRGILDAIFKN